MDEAEDSERRDAVPRQMLATPKAANKTSRPTGRASKGTTSPGYVNPNQQEVIRSTGLDGTDHNQKIYVLKCQLCGNEYGANGSDIHRRRCPNHDGGAPGLSL